MSVLLAGRFALQEKIGEGTFAEVWRATDLRPEGSAAEVALKLFRPLASGVADDAWEPVYREVAAGLRMPSHPNIVRSWALFPTSFFGGQFTLGLAMDLVDGTNLALWLASEPPPGLATTARRLAVIEGLLHGVAHTHAHGVAHQDISFGNVMVRRSGPLGGLLSDFGCAMTADAGSADTAVPEESGELQPINPPPYALRQTRAASLRRDVYAFATLSYLALVGRHPLSDDWQRMRTGLWHGPAAPHAVLARRRLVDLGPWLQEMPGMMALSDLLLQCVAADPAERPPAKVVLDQWMKITAVLTRGL